MQQKQSGAEIFFSMSFLLLNIDKLLKSKSYWAYQAVFLFQPLVWG